METEQLVQFLEKYQRPIVSLLVILALWTLRVVLHRLINREVPNLRERYIWRQTVTYIAILLGIVALLQIWAEWFRTTITLLSLIAAALVIVSKEFVLNVVAYGVIIWRGLFSVGDRIQIGPHAGDVMEVGPMYITVAEIGNWVNHDESTGRVLKIPNSWVLNQTVANYSRGLALVWNEITIELTAPSNWKKARSIAQEIARTYSHEFTDADLDRIRNASEEMVFTQREPSVFVRLQGSKISLTLRYACPFHHRRRIEQQVWESLLDRLIAEEDIKLAGGESKEEKVKS